MYSIFLLGMCLDCARLFNRRGKKEMDVWQTRRLVNDWNVGLQAEGRLKSGEYFGLALGDKLLYLTRCRSCFCDAAVRWMFLCRRPSN